MAEPLDGYNGKFRIAMSVKDVDYITTDEYAHFRCPCGEEITLCEGGETMRCDCGKVYRLIAYVGIAE
jgi:hypothetical protein